MGWKYKTEEERVAGRRAVKRAYAAKTHERLLERRRLWRRRRGVLPWAEHCARVAAAKKPAKPTTPPKRPDDKIVRRLRGEFGMWLRITRGQLREMHERQNGLCAICGRPPRPVRGRHHTLHVDHDHARNAPRELLCGGCNVALGSLDDNAALCRAAAEYLERHNAVPRERNRSVEVRQARGA